MTSQLDGSEHASKQPRDRTGRNKRRNERLPSGARITLKWQGPSEETHFAHGIVLDYSETGLRLEVEEPIQPRSYVMLSTASRNRAGWAGWVRHCASKGTKYSVGLELAAGARCMDLGDPRFS
jgi:hypothetical protein